MKTTKGPLFLTLSLKSIVAVVGIALVVLVSTSLIQTMGGLSSFLSMDWRKPSSPSTEGEQPPPPPSPLRGVKVAVDPGHGGVDRGVCHFPDGLIEKEINLDMAYRLLRALEELGADVILTRDDDAFVGLDDRAQAANDRDADVFLSLHVNRMPGHPGCFGAQTFYYPGSVAGETLAKALQEELIKADPDNYRTPLTGQFKVLRLAAMPGALVEIGFMTNERDRALMQSDDYRDKITGAIVAGLINFIGVTMEGEAPLESS